MRVVEASEVSRPRRFHHDLETIEQVGCGVGRTGVLEQAHIGRNGVERGYEEERAEAATSPTSTDE